MVEYLKIECTSLNCVDNLGLGIEATCLGSPGYTWRHLLKTSFASTSSLLHCEDQKFDTVYFSFSPRKRRVRCPRLGGGDASILNFENLENVRDIFCYKKK